MSERGRVGERSSRETSGSEGFIRVSSGKFGVRLVLKVERGERRGESEIEINFLFEGAVTFTFAFYSEGKDTGDSHWSFCFAGRSNSTDMCL